MQRPGTDDDRMIRDEVRPMHVVEIVDPDDLRGRRGARVRSRGAERDRERENANTKVHVPPIRGAGAPSRLVDLLEEADEVAAGDAELERGAAPVAAVPRECREDLLALHEVDLPS
jgi:hypothetical protein